MVAGINYVPTKAKALPHERASALTPKSSLRPLQGVSANTACFHSLSFKAGSTRIHGLVPASHSISEADLYLDAQSHRSVTVHANPLWTDTDQQAPALAHQAEPELDLACQRSADGQAHLQVPHTTAQHTPLPKSSVPQQVPQLSLQQAEMSENSYSGSKQHVSSVSKQSKSSQMSGSPLSARSSQSDATHLDHLDGCMSERHWQEAQQQSAAGLSPFDDASLPSTSGCLTPDSETAFGDRAERWVNNQMLAHDAAGTSFSESEASLSGYSVSANPLAWPAADEQSPR